MSVRVTITHGAGSHSGAWASAVAPLAAALRDGHTVTVTTATDQTPWAITVTNGAVAIAVINPDVFAIDLTPPAWVERLAAAAACFLI